MSRIGACFARLREKNKKALIPFITAGDPQLDATLPLMQTLVEAGADIIELGVPFSDPMAEGPIIQRASERALANHAYMDVILDQVKQFRQHNSTTPIVLMGYLNPIEFIGYSEFAQQAHNAGVDGVLTVDLPAEEASEYRDCLQSHDIDPIFLLAPTSPESRIKKVAEMGSGFVYYVSLKGVTGADSLQSGDIGERIQQLRKHCSWPLAVGFGIKDAESARNIAQWADAVVVGSAIIARIEECIHQNASKQAMLTEVSNFIKPLRQAIDAVTA